MLRHVMKASHKFLVFSFILYKISFCSSLPDKTTEIDNNICFDHIYDNLSSSKNTNTVILPNIYDDDCKMYNIYEKERNSCSNEFDYSNGNVKKYDNNETKTFQNSKNITNYNNTDNHADNTIEYKLIKAKNNNTNKTSDMDGSFKTHIELCNPNIDLENSKSSNTCNEISINAAFSEKCNNISISACDLENINPLKDNSTEINYQIQPLITTPEQCDKIITKNDGKDQDENNKSDNIIILEKTTTNADNYRLNLKMRNFFNCNHEDIYPQKNKQYNLINRTLNSGSNEKIRNLKINNREVIVNEEQEKKEIFINDDNKNIGITFKDFNLCDERNIVLFNSYKLFSAYENNLNIFNKKISDEKYIPDSLKIKNSEIVEYIEVLKYFCNVIEKIREIKTKLYYLNKKNRIQYKQKRYIKKCEKSYVRILSMNTARIKMSLMRKINKHLTLDNEILLQKLLNIIDLHSDFFTLRIYHINCKIIDFLGEVFITNNDELIEFFQKNLADTIKHKKEEYKEKWNQFTTLYEKFTKIVEEKIIK